VGTGAALDLEVHELARAWTRCPSFTRMERHETGPSPDAYGRPSRSRALEIVHGCAA